MHVVLWIQVRRITESLKLSFCSGVGRKALFLWTLLSHLHRPRGWWTPLWMSSSLGIRATGSHFHNHYRLGRKNDNVDALSKSRQELLLLSRKTVQLQWVGRRTQRQRAASGPCELKTSTLPNDEKMAWELAFTKSQYLIWDGVLYWVEKDRTTACYSAQVSKKGIIPCCRG